jgi:hypothetical protein
VLETKEIVVDRTIWITLASVALTAATLTSQNKEPELPPRLDSYLAKQVGLSSRERERLRRGGPVARLFDVDEVSEVSVVGAIWINAPIRRYVEALEDIERFESGPAFRVTRRIGEPPDPGDFADWRLPQQDVEDLRRCRVGDCNVKLTEGAIKRLQAEVNWSAPDARAAVDALIRQFALEYVKGYLAEGNKHLAEYRDKSRPRSVAQEFSEMIDQMPELAIFMPEMREYLLAYPDVSLPDSTSFLYWQETAFGLKPTIRISHLTIREGPNDTVVASKMLYASHYFWSAVELRMLLPDPSRGPGFWYVIVNRSRSDGLRGLTGLFVRPRVRSRARDGALAVLRSTKRNLEQPAQ